jgi:glycine cleavage system transcriptional repressor
MMVLVSGAAEVLEKVKRDIGELSGRSSLHVEVHQARESAKDLPQQSLAYRLKATAIDQPGLVHRVAHLLRAAKANIESLDTRLMAAPYTGAPMFEMEWILAVPKSTQLSQLRQDISRLCDELNVDWNLDPA